MPTSNHQFGLVIAYLLPGFIALAGIAPLAPTVAVWIRPSTYAEASLGPPIYAVLTAITLGMLTSCFRWVLIDQIHHHTGVMPPTWDDARLSERLAAFNYLVESHYRYYQFVANSLVAVLWSYVVNRSMNTSLLFGLGTDLAVVVLCIVLFAASRDALTKYYARTGKLIGGSMTNRSKREGDVERRR